MSGNFVAVRVFSIYKGPFFQVLVPFKLCLNRSLQIVII